MQSFVPDSAERANVPSEIREACQDVVIVGK
jgi:hypothetical protein